jgi:hypothetical protein
MESPPNKTDTNNSEHFSGVVELYSWGGRQLFVDRTNEFVIDHYDASTVPFAEDARLWTIEWGPGDISDDGSFMSRFQYDDFPFSKVGHSAFGDSPTLLARYENGDITTQ